MNVPLQSSNEEERLGSLQSYEILDTLPEAAYDDIVGIASRMLGTPIAAISLSDATRQWFKARIGLNADHTARDASFCNQVVVSGTPLVIPDATCDERFADNTLVTGPLGLRFYAGAPLINEAGFALGTLCVIDRQPRTMSADDVQMLEALARQVTLLLELRRRVQDAERTTVELRKVEHAAITASRAKSDFLATMSHELRTPLNSVIGFTNIMLKNKARNLGQRDLDFLKRIGTNGKHLLRLINDVLDLSKIEAGRIELELTSVDVPQLVVGVLNQLEGQSRAADVRLACSYPSRVEPLNVDERRLRQILINLVGNAIKFASDGQVEVRIVTSLEGQLWRIDVVDDGVGIAADDQERIFRSFQQAEQSTARRFGGTGLGLTLSRSLSEMMGFRLEVCSELGRGSIFSVVVHEDAPPLVYQSPRPDGHPGVIANRSGSKTAEFAVVVRRERSRDRKTVLIIDDDADARAVLEGYIADYGGRVIAVDSGERALEMARTARPDLITLDLLMPDVDGWAVLRGLSSDAELRNIPVVICSIADGFSRASLAGAATILAKPVERDQFHETLNDYLVKHDLPQTDIRSALDECLGPVIE